MQSRHIVIKFLNTKDLKLVDIYRQLTELYGWMSKTFAIGAGNLQPVVLKFLTRQLGMFIRKDRISTAKLKYRKVCCKRKPQTVGDQNSHSTGNI